MHCDLNAQSEYMTYDESGFAMHRENWVVARVALSCAARHQLLGQTDLGAWGTEIGNHVPREPRQQAYVPYAVHLFSVLIYKCSNGVWRAVVLINFDETVISLLQLAGSLAR
jgi:hypothetical protein